MRNLNFYHLLFALIFITACKKEDDSTVSVKDVFRDSLSFEINGKTYAFKGGFFVGSGNR